MSREASQGDSSAFWSVRVMFWQLLEGLELAGGARSGCGSICCSRDPAAVLDGINNWSKGSAASEHSWGLRMLACHKDS